MKKQEKPFAFRGKYFFLAVCVLYTIFYMVNRSSALLALQKSGSVLIKVLPIFIIVVCFTALINFFIQPQKVAKHLGYESGVRGWLWALASGVVSHGPMYAWYPLLEDLRSQGMKDGLVVVFFASRAIKVPLLPMMVDYFGLSFTITLSVYILLGAVLQGIILEAGKLGNRP